VGQLHWTSLGYVTASQVTAGNPLPTEFRLQADQKAINSAVIGFSNTLTIEVEAGIRFTAGNSVSQPSYMIVPRSVRPGVYDMVVQIAGSANINFTSNNIFVVHGLVVVDGYGPVLDVTKVLADETSVELTVKTDEACSVWCQAVFKNADAPALPDGYKNHPADANFTAAGTKTFNLTGLIANREYAVYCYGEDALNHPNTANEIYNTTHRVFQTVGSGGALNSAGPGKTGLAPASVAGIVIGAIIGVLLLILLAVGIKRWLNSRSDWTKNESLFLEAELAQKKKPAAADVQASSAPGPSSPASPAAAGVSSGKGNDGLPTL